MQKKWVLFSFEFPPVGGGISRLCSEIYNILKKDVRLDASVLTQQGAVGEDKITVSASRPQREMQAREQLKAFGNIDVLLTGVWYPEGFLGLKSQAQKKILLAHGLELMPHKNWLKRPLWTYMLKKTLREYDLVIANSQFTKKLVQKICPESNVDYIPLGVDHQKFDLGDKVDARRKLKLSRDKFLIVTVARIQEYKGFDLVFRALGALPKEVRAKVEYIIAGTGPDEQKIKGMAEKFGVADMVQWLGFVDDQVLPKLYQASDLFVMCSRENFKKQTMEGFGLVLLEAQACGCPVICTRSGGMPDAVKEGVGGWLIEQDDVRGLRDRIQNLVGDGAELKRQGQLARNRVEQQCTWYHYKIKLFKILEDHGIKL